MSVIFSTQFQNSLDVDFPEGAPHGSNFRRIPGRGIDGGYAITCTSGGLLKNIAPYGSLTSTAVTLRTQWGFTYAGDFYDDISGISGIHGYEIFYAGDPLDANTSTSGALSLWLRARPNGMLTLYVNQGGSGSTTHTFFDSASGVLNYDGRMHGIQLSLQLTNHSTLVYNVVVNNVSVLSGTYVINVTIGGFTSCVGKKMWGWFGQIIDGVEQCNERAAMTDVSVSAYFYNNLGGSGIYKGWQTSVTEFEIEDSVSIISYLPKNAPNAVIDNCVVAVGTLVVFKAFNSELGSKRFDFTTSSTSGGSITPATFSLAQGESRNLTTTPSGSYGVTEVPDPDYITSYSVSSGGTDNLHIVILTGNTKVLTVTNTPVVVIDPIAPSGIYFINPNKTTKHDSYYGSIEKKIPNPTVKTGLLGE